MSFEECMKRRLLVRIKPQKDLSEKEFVAAEKDLERAKQTFETKDFKWTIIQVYYSMFHAVKGVLYLIGIKERSHGCVVEALTKLSEKGLTESYLVEEYKSSMEARKSADYRHIYSEESAMHVIEIAGEFLKMMKELSKKVKPNEI